MSFLGAKRRILRSIHSLVRVIGYIGFVTLSGMVLITTTNVFGRYILKKPLLGEFDMVELGMAILGGIAMFLAATQHHHVRVDVLTVRFSRPTQVILGRIAALLGFLTLVGLAIGVFLDGLDKVKNGSSTDTLLVPHGPFAIILSIGMFLFCLTSLIQIFRPEESEKDSEGGPQL
jgi:TRAP-type C4-dicarboxylate transport system permease small subunit